MKKKCTNVQTYRNPCNKFSLVPPQTPPLKIFYYYLHNLQKYAFPSIPIMKQLKEILLSNFGNQNVHIFDGQFDETAGVV